MDDRYIVCVLDLQVEYTNGDLSWHPIDLVKYEELQAVANYILDNDVGMIPNGIHRRWARSFLRALKCAIKSIKCVDFYDLEASTFDPGISRKARRKYTKRASKAQTEGPIHVPPKRKRN